MTTRPLNVLLDKTSDWDKDERYMATNDLCSILSKDTKLTEDQEKKICAAVLKQLDDPSNDVQSVAVKCLSIILKKVKQAQIGEICTKLISLILDGKDALRDIYSIALKTLIADVPDSMGVLVADLLTARLLNGLARVGSDDIQKECLDNMCELLKRFGHLNERDHVDIMNIVTKQLKHDKAIIRKRSANCVGALAVVSSDVLLNQLVSALLDQIAVSEEQKHAVHTRTLIQTIGTISRTVGYRLGRHLNRIVPLFLRFCGDADDESQQTDEANELRESCFPGLESCVHTCPKEVSAFLPDILKVTLSFVRYDPNYSYDDAREECDSGDMVLAAGDASSDYGGDEDDENGDEYYGQEEFGGGSDDDDTSWKVRKSALKVISNVITARPDMIRSLVESCGLALLNRFKEREENVRFDIIVTFTTLIRKTLSTEDSAAPSSTFSAVSVPVALTRQMSSGGDLIEAMIPRIISESLKHLSQVGVSSSVKTKSAILSLLRTLVAARNGGFDPYLQRLLHATEKSMGEKNQALKLEALVFIREVLKRHSAEVCQPLLPLLVPVMVAAVGDEWYKIIAEALRVAAAIVRVIRPNVALPVSADMAAANHVVPLYDAIFSRLGVVDIDQEIKECSIVAVGALFSHLGDHPLLQSQFPAVLAILHRRLDNENTRIAALNALARMAGSSLNLDLGECLASTGCELAAFLRQTHQSSRLLKQCTLQTLEALVVSKSTVVTKPLVDCLLADVACVLTDSDLHLCHLGLKLCVCVLTSECQPTNAPADGFGNHIYPKLLILARSPLLHGQALSSLVALFQTILNGPVSLPVISFAVIFGDLYTRQQNMSDMPKLSISNLSKCIAGICTPTAVLSDGAALQFAKDINTNLASGNHKALQLALLCLGDVGQVFDLCGASSSAGSVNQWLSCVVPCFESANEDTKVSAAYCLGHMTVGNMAAFLPTVLGGNTAQQQYLLLAALKEVILVHVMCGLDFRAYEQVVLPVLFQHCQGKAGIAGSAAAVAEVAVEGGDRAGCMDDSVRTMVAECLGALMSISTAVVPLLQSLLTTSGIKGGDGSNKSTRLMTATTLRFAVVRCSASAAASNSLASARQQSSSSVSAAGDGVGGTNSGAQAGFVSATQAMADVGLNDQVMTEFLPLLRDPDLDVKKAALMLVNIAVHHCPELVANQLRDMVLPILLETLLLKLERTVDLGPFKHKVDDNLTLRKVALSCVDTILDVCPQRMDVSATMAILPTVLADKDEIKMQAHQIIAKLRTYSPGAVLGSVELLIDPLEKTIMKKPPKPEEDTESTVARKEAGGNPDQERAAELVRSALRCAVALNNIEDISLVSRKWLEFIDRLRKTEHISSMMTSLQEELALDQ